MNHMMNASTQRGGYNDSMDTSLGVAALTNLFRLLQ
jgi:hypothetical protein